MSEITKLYENARVEPYRYCHNCKDDNGKRIENSINCPSRKSCVNTCDTPEYDFTSEKQIELTKWLIQNKRLCIYKAEYSNNFYMDTLATRLNGVDNSSFEECLASILNLIWQDLTDIEKRDIKEILIRCV